MCNFDRQFLIRSYLLRFAQNGTRKLVIQNGTTKLVLLFMTMQKLRSYTQQLTHNGMLKLDYLFLDTPCRLVYDRKIFY